jgi:hypothetical protein
MPSRSKIQMPVLPKFLALLGLLCPIAEAASCNAQEEDVTSLVQMHHSLHQRSGISGNQLSLNSGDTSSKSCAKLHNKGAYFSVKVKVGTPVKGEKQQEFELVADTGSDSVIVTSCVCVQNQYCDAKDRCFKGTNHSSSFEVKEKPVNKTSNKTAPMGVAMTFGSGTVMSIIATDVVQVGGLSTTLHDGLLLMVDRRLLNIEGEFQGILGLGPPDRTNNTHSKGGEEVLGSTGDKSESGHADESKAVVVQKSKEHTNKEYAPKLFLQQAGVQRYSLCFNDAGDDGAMRLNVPAFKQTLPTIGAFHWGLGLHGISVGDEDNDAFVCTKDDIKGKNQKTPCGAIPDSGTTLLMGPEDHIAKMFSNLCDKWDRCQKAYGHGNYTNTTKHHAFQKLLYDCAEWKTEDKGIDEVPSIFFKVGEPGNQQQLELSAWSYIVETTHELYKYKTRYLFGIIPEQVPYPTGKFKKVCVPSIGVQSYDTEENGPVWIMGHPLFYQFNVGYNLAKYSADGIISGDENKMAMAFEKEKCGSCDDSNADSDDSEKDSDHADADDDDSKASLLSSQHKLTREGRARPMRFETHLPHVREMDTSLPL